MHTKLYNYLCTQFSFSSCIFLYFLLSIFACLFRFVRFQEAFINSSRLIRHGIGSIYRIVIRPRRAQEREVSKGIRCQTIEQFDNRGLIELNSSVVLVFTTSWLVGLRLLCWSDNSRVHACAPPWLTILDERPRVSHRSMLSFDWNYTSIDIPQTYLLWPILSKLCRNIEHWYLNHKLWTFYTLSITFTFPILIYTINLSPIFYIRMP